MMYIIYNIMGESKTYATEKSAIEACKRLSNPINIIFKHPVADEIIQELLEPKVLIFLGNVYKIGK